MGLFYKIKQAFQASVDTSNVVKGGEKPTTIISISTDTNIYTSPNLSLLTGILSGIVDTSTIVSNTQDFFDEFSKTIQDIYLVSSLNKMAYLWDLNKWGTVSVTSVTM